jgi:hypothetical protein
MTRALPFTKASLRRVIEAVESAGKFVIAIRPDGTIVVGDKPVDATYLTPENQPASKWEDQRV